MNTKGDIIIIEDETDTTYLLKNIFADLNYENNVIFFDNPDKAFDYFKNPKSDPFIIIADVDISNPGGFDLRKKIFKDPATVNKCVPYIYITGKSSDDHLCEAFRQSIQGYFLKKDNYNDQKIVIRKLSTIGKMPLYHTHYK